jgi:hypothetical protein
LAAFPSLHFGRFRAAFLLENPMAQNEITATFSVGGMPTESKVSYPLPPDPHAPHADDGDNDLANPMEMGVDESKEVGHTGSIDQYGISGPSAGGGIKRNTQE